MLYVFDDCMLDIQCCVLCRAGQPVSLRPKAFQVLHYLLLHRDRVVTKQELAEHIWSDQFISDAVLESTVRSVMIVTPRVISRHCGATAIALWRLLKNVQTLARALHRRSVWRHRPPLC